MSPEHTDPNSTVPGRTDGAQPGGGHGTADRPDAGAAGRPSDWSRRRFGKVTLASTPVLMTLYGKPLWAGANCTASGWVSGNTSLHQDLRDCGGRTPGYWQGPASKDHYAGWHGTKDERLDSMYGFPTLGVYLVSVSGNDGVNNAPATLQHAVEGPGATTFNGTTMPVRQLLRFGMAALLNARYIVGYALTESQVVAMVTSAILEGAYVTPSGEILTADQVKRFLENTMNTPQWGP